GALVRKTEEGLEVPRCGGRVPRGWPRVPKTPPGALFHKTEDKRTCPARASVFGNRAPGGGFRNPGTTAGAPPTPPAAYSAALRARLRSPLPTPLRRSFHSVAIA